MATKRNSVMILKFLLSHATLKNIVRPMVRKHEEDEKIDCVQPQRQ